MEASEEGEDEDEGRGREEAVREGHCGKPVGMSSRRSEWSKSKVLINGVASCFTPSLASPFAPRGHADARAESASVGATCLVACNANLSSMWEA